MVKKPEKDYTLKVNTKKDDDKDETLPIYMDRIKLTDTQKTRLVKEIYLESDEIESEWRAEDVIGKFDALDNQYKGKIEEDERRQFNLSTNVTKSKCNKVSNMTVQSFLETDPKYSITPRPEFEKQGGTDVCDGQQDFLDYKLDNLSSFRSAMARVSHHSTLKGLGVLKVTHKITREKKKREEEYDGSILKLPNGTVYEAEKHGPVPPGVELVNQGLKDFLDNYPDAETRYKGFVKKLTEGKKISIIAEYEDTTYNDPFFKSVNPKNLKVRLSTPGIEGLKITRLVIEESEMSWWDLKREEKAGHFEDIDKLAQVSEGDTTKKDKYDHEMYKILECVYYFKMNEDDEDEQRIVVWIADERKMVLGAINYPYYLIDTYYIPFFINDKWDGWLQPGMGEDLTDNHIAESFILNFTLEGAYQTNVVTPIVQEGSPVASQFLNKEFMHGIPIELKKGEKIDFLQKYMKPFDINGMLGLFQVLLQNDDDVTGVSTASATGRPDPLDPRAPGNKTIALLQQSGINIKNYIFAMLPSFNELGYVILNMYFQMSKEGRKYKIRPERVVGKNPFATLERSAMSARTNIQAQAYTFNFEKLNEKREDVALYQIARQEPLIARNPESVYIMLKNIIKGWSPKWRNMVDTILPPLAEFKKGQAKMALMALQKYLMGKKSQQEMTGIPAEFKAVEFIPMMNELMALSATQPAKENKEQ